MTRETKVQEDLYLTAVYKSQWLEITWHISDWRMDKQAKLVI